MTRAKQMGKSMALSAALRLIETTGKESAGLESALTQVALYVEPRSDIQPQDIDVLLGRSVQTDVFQLSQHILSKDVRAALILMDGALDTIQMNPRAVPANRMKR
jgi:DNA polymerase III delta subunit